MDLTSQYSLAGIRLFSSDQDLMSQLPSESLRTRFTDISGLVSTYENFTEASSFERLLKLDFTSNSLNNSNVSQVIDILNNTMFTQGACKNTNSPTNLYDSNYTIRTRDVNPHLARNIIDKMRSQLEILPPDLEPLSDGSTTIRIFRNLMRSVCTEIWKFHYENLQEFMNSVNATVKLPIIDSFEWLANRFCDYVHLNASRSADKFYSSDCSDTNTHFNIVHRVLMEYTRNEESFVDTVQSNHMVMRFFISCFYPYFMFDFILNNIATQNMDSIDKAPRYYMLRRFAVLASYMCLFYVAFSVRDIEVNTARYVLAKINDDLFAKEMASSNMRLSYTEIHQDTTENAKLSHDLAKISQDVMASRGNLNKALTNDIGVNTKISRAKSVMYMWIAFAIITFVGCAALYFFMSPDKMKYMYMYIMIMTSVLFIYWIVALANRI